MTTSALRLREPRRLPVLGVALVAAVAAGGALGLARPSGDWLTLAALALLPLGALIVAGPARAATIAASLAYAAALVVVYRARITPTYGYAGLIDAAPDVTTMLIVTAIAALPATWIPIPARRASTVVMWVVYLMAYLPAVVLLPFFGGDFDTVLRLDLALLGSMALIALILQLPIPRIDVRPVSPTTFTRILTGLSVACSLYVIAGFGIQSLPSVEDVYGRRDEFKLAVGGVPGAGYLIGWATGVVNPLLIAWGIARKRPALVVLGVVGQLVVYMVTGYKASLFSIAFIPLVYVAIAMFRRSFALVMCAGTTVVLLIAVVEGLGRTPLSLAARTYATPAQLTWYFFEYFSAHPKYELSHSFLRFAGATSPYVQEPPDLIGSVYFPGKGTHANAGLWADAFANFGFAGILGFTVAFGLLLWGADAVSRGRDLAIAGSLLAVGALAVNSGALFIAILTNGIVLSLVLILYMPPVAAPRPAPSRTRTGGGDPRMYHLRAEPQAEYPTGAQRRKAARAARLAAGPDRTPVGALPPPGTVLDTAPVEFPPPATDLNTATVEQLRRLPGMGLATAQSIVAYREEHGGFSSVDELKDVPGIGPTRFRALEGLVTT